MNRRFAVALVAAIVASGAATVLIMRDSSAPPPPEPPAETNPEPPAERDIAAPTWQQVRAPRAVAQERPQVEVTVHNSVSVRVVDTSGAPIVDAHVSLTTAITTGMEQWTQSSAGRTEETGECEISDLLPGSYTVEAWKEGYVTGYELVDVPAKKKIVIALERGYSVTVKVRTSDGKPVAGARVRSLAGTARGGGSLETLVDGIAEFRFAERAPRIFAVEKEGYDPETVEEETSAEICVVLTKGSAVTFRLLTDEPELPPVAAVRVNLGGERQLPVEDRNLRLKELAAGTYTFDVLVPGFARAKTEEVELDGQEKIDVDVPLSKGGTIRGSVIDAETGSPAIGARVQFSQEGGGATVTTDGEGLFEFRHVLGSGRIHISQEDRCPESLDQAITVEEGQTVTIPPVYLMKGATILVKIENVPEEMRRVGSISVSGSVGRFGSRMSFGGLSPVHRFSNIPPGTYSISVSLGEQRRTGSVTIAEGQDEVEISFDLAEGN